MSYGVPVTTIQTPFGLIPLSQTFHHFFHYPFIAANAFD